MSPSQLVLSLVPTLTLSLILCHLSCSQSLECITDDLRLSDGRNEQEGRLEACMNGVWGTICNNRWNMRSTSVACRQLGIGDRGYYLNRFPAAASQVPILFTNVVCTGEEQIISNCTRQIPSGECLHRDDVRLVCLPPETPPDCEDGNLRLRDGNSPFRGRLEICEVGVWGTVCEYLWDRRDAMVACHQLGFNVTAAYSGRHLGGSGAILLSGVSCTGDEEVITQCQSSSAVLHDHCVHGFDVDIYCSTLTEPECSEGELRLVDGRSEYEGRVEVCQGGLWGSVCDHRWRVLESGIVACRQAGINAIGASFGEFGVSEGPTHLSAVRCHGTESSLFQCSHSSSANSNTYCYPSEAVGVICELENHTAECVEESVRLVDPSGVPAEGGSGIVEMCVNEQWSRVCHETWDRAEAAVVCRELGYLSLDVVGYLIDVEYSGPMVSASCKGFMEDTILYSCLGSYICLTPKHASVICNSSDSVCTDGDLRLEGSELVHGGRLEMCYFGIWGTICDADWIISNAIVACRQLGFGTKGAQFISQFTPRGTGPVVLYNILCSGGEDSLLDCTHNPLNHHSCGRFQNVGVYCLKPEEPTTHTTTLGLTDSANDTTESGTTDTGTADVVNMLINTTTLWISTITTPAASTSRTTLATVAALGGLVLVLIVAVIAACFCVIRRASKQQTVVSSTNAAFNMEELDLSTSVNAGVRSMSINGANEYNLKCNIGPTVSLRPKEHLLSFSSTRVKSSFIRHLSDDFIVPLDNLTLLVKIGEGEFGVVYKAKLSGIGEDKVVAVKTLKGMYDQDQVDSMLEEGLKLKHFRHQNVLSLIGVCVEASPAPYIVMPFMSNGSLLSYLRQEKMALVLPDTQDEDIVEDVTKRLTTMCQQISMGMRYLAGEKFVHRDLAARNCMIDEHYQIKIADFGLSEDIYSKTYFRQENDASVKLPVKWMALESLQEGVFSEKTDVWSFGVTCWEVFSGGKNPYSGIGPMAVVELLEHGERMTPPNNAACTKKMFELMKSCWQLDPKLRPSFATINTLLDDYLEELAGYINMQSSLFPEMQRQLEKKQQLKEERSPSKSPNSERSSIAVVDSRGRSSSKSPNMKRCSAAVLEGGRSPSKSPATKRGSVPLLGDKGRSPSKSPATKRGNVMAEQKPSEVAISVTYVP